jgi:hypothetical protein
MPSLIRLSRFQSAPGEATFKALQNIVLFVRENIERCSHKRPRTLWPKLHVNWKDTRTSGFFYLGGLLSYQFVAVIDEAVAMSSEPEDKVSPLPVNMPSSPLLLRP